jgi:hypothetical protein
MYNQTAITSWFLATGYPAGCAASHLQGVRHMQRKIFWITFLVLGLVADLSLPLWVSLVATIPIGVFSWWLAYRSEWFE